MKGRVYSYQLIIDVMNLDDFMIISYHDSTVVDLTLLLYDVNHEIVYQLEQTSRPVGPLMTMSGNISQ